MEREEGACAHRVSAENALFFSHTGHSVCHVLLSEAAHGAHTYLSVFLSSALQARQSRGNRAWRREAAQPLRAGELSVSCAKAKSVTTSNSSHNETVRYFCLYDILDGQTHLACPVPLGIGDVRDVTNEGAVK